MRLQWFVQNNPDYRDAQATILMTGVVYDHRIDHVVFESSDELLGEISTKLCHDDIDRKHTSDMDKG